MESEIEKARGLRVVVTEVVRKYEVFCENEKGLDTITHLGEPFIRTTGSPLRALDQFTEEKKELLFCTSNLKENFDNLDERQIKFVELKIKLCDFRDKLTLVQHGFLRAINMFIDSLENTRAELIEKKQLDAIESSLKMVHWATEDFEVNLIQEILVKSGLKPIPNLEGIAKLY